MYPICRKLQTCETMARGGCSLLSFLRQKGSLLEPPPVSAERLDAGSASDSDCPLILGHSLVALMWMDLMPQFRSDSSASFATSLRSSNSDEGGGCQSSFGGSHSD